MRSGEYVYQENEAPRGQPRASYRACPARSTDNRSVCLPRDDAVLDINLPRARTRAVDAMRRAHHFVALPPVAVERLRPALSWGQCAPATAGGIRIAAQEPRCPQQRVHAPRTHRSQVLRLHGPTSARDPRWERSARAIRVGRASAPTRLSTAPTRARPGDCARIPDSRSSHPAPRSASCATPAGGGIRSAARGAAPGTPPRVQARKGMMRAPLAEMARGAQPRSALLTATCGHGCTPAMAAGRGE